jgi:hypothetical protein
MRALLLLALFAARAFADEDAVTQARARFREGADLVQKAQWAEALAAFEQSARLRPHPITQYNIGACERALGRYTRARATLAAAVADTTGQLPESLQTEARGWLDEIDRLLAHARLRIEPADATVALDGHALDASPEGRWELALDPGAHVLTVSRQGWKDVVVNKSYAPGATEELTLALDRLPAKLHVAANIAGAAVELDGLDVGVAPVELSRPAGSYRVVVRKPGWQPYQAQVALRAGEAADLRAALEPHKTPIYKRWWFWTAAGVVVAAAILGGYFGAVASQPQKVDGGGLGWSVNLR